MRYLFLGLAWDIGPILLPIIGLIVANKLSALPNPYGKGKLARHKRSLLRRPELLVKLSVTCREWVKTWNPAWRKA